MEMQQNESDEDFEFYAPPTGLSFADRIEQTFDSVFGFMHLAAGWFVAGLETFEWLVHRLLACVKWIVTPSRWFGSRKNNDWDWR